ncbi:CSEP0075 putative effector protein [Blumeria hordei DH14]|uniref:CSEP0075 putative effector protein n=1 Tax=Blumeria graminis f. sp. hordei (strain DH14) TaxID=546991 RepID=N1JJW4_BLUG1|nr:CSEP0075 putative effector protein [Blumeria hordei DH14]
MKISLVASLVAILSNSMPTLALDGYNCLGQVLSHDLLTEEINLSYDKTVPQDPGNEFFTDSSISVPLVFSISFPQPDYPLTKVKILFNHRKQIIAVQAFAWDKYFNCEEIIE